MVNVTNLPLRHSAFCGAKVLVYNNIYSHKRAWQHTTSFCLLMDSFVYVSGHPVEVVNSVVVSDLVVASMLYYLGSHSTTPNNMMQRIRYSKN
jgi:uncharacterized membrane protein